MVSPGRSGNGASAPIALATSRSVVPCRSRSPGNAAAILIGSSVVVKRARLARAALYPIRRMEVQGFAPERAIAVLSHGDTETQRTDRGSTSRVGRVGIKPDRQDTAPPPAWRSLRPLRFPAAPRSRGHFSVSPYLCGSPYASELKRLGHVLGADVILVREIGNRPRDLAHAIVAARAQRQFPDGRFQHGHRLLIDRAIARHERRRQFRVRADVVLRIAIGLPRPCGNDPRTDGGGRLGGAGVAERVD